MKKLLLLALAVCLCGCASAPRETVQDTYTPGKAVMRTWSITLPDDASVLTATDCQAMYFCNGFEAQIECLPAGDLSATIKAVTGLSKDALTILTTQGADWDRSVFGWTGTGEEGSLIMQTTILSDGNYHYCLTLSALEADAPAVRECWANIGASFCLEGS